ncbi:hypothetical protein DUI87_06883 [Hirundo rustica rustica]|uniref:Snake toxin/toxin-like domain-containing protein n=1 Tax=Hirundo rustica rustica TaxID=333673 RepID=A0A3M0KQ32_HIRRU|nr:hypothetical protein DUI87_06883 [Hirundo rustica rustica]
MKFSLLAVLALVLFAAQANALYCYTCNWEQSNWSCLKAEKCSDKDEYCVTNVASVGIASAQRCREKMDPGGRKSLAGFPQEGVDIEHEE